ncbi:MAG: FAD-dependent oxidoreductase [Steroidobacteraceae bacterium]
MTSAADVIVVGGGIVGTSASFFLRRRGLSVILLERDFVGQQASGVNFGNVRRQGRPAFEIPIANRAIATWRRMRELTGSDVEYLQAGHMRICYRERPELVQRFHDHAREVGPLGLHLQVLEGAALRERFPWLGPDVIAGSLSPEDGHANPRLASPAFARAARRDGAQVLENTPVRGIESAGEDFEVSAGDGTRYRAPALLICAGAWSSALSARFGEPVPLVTRAPTMSVTEPAPYAIAPSIGVSTPLELESVYFRQIPRGNVIIGGSTRGPSYTDERRAPVVPENTLSQLREIRRLAPALARLQLIRVWSGVESYPPDDRPVIGASGRVRGLYYGFGFAGSGFQIGPGVGETLAELIATGRSEIDLSPYRVQRFAQGPLAPGS